MPIIEYNDPIQDYDQSDLWYDAFGADTQPETLSLAETILSTLSELELESLVITDVGLALIGELESELLALSDSASEFFGAIVSESLPLTETSSAQLLLSVAESLPLTDSASAALRLLVAEALSLSEETASALVKRIAKLLVKRIVPKVLIKKHGLSTSATQDFIYDEATLDYDDATTLYGLRVLPSPIVASLRPKILFAQRTPPVSEKPRAEVSRKTAKLATIR